MTEVSLESVLLVSQLITVCLMLLGNLRFSALHRASSISSTGNLQFIAKFSKSLYLV